MTDAHAKLAAVRTFPELVSYLRDELDWPISTDDFEDLTYDYTPEELGIDRHNAAKIQGIKRLKPLVVTQPWGVFFVMFEPARLPVVALRRILGSVALKKRASANRAERAVWDPEDLLFISSFGEGDTRQISFARFAQVEGNPLPTLNVLGWDNLDTALHVIGVAETLGRHLRWPTNPSDERAWREDWRSAFTIRNREVITTSKTLAVRLAVLARAIRQRIETVLSVETHRGPVTTLMNAFRESLMHDLGADEFADMYAQTIAYGLLSARILNPNGHLGDTLAGSIPVTNPFLRELMSTFMQVDSPTVSTPSLDFDELGISEVVQLLDDANMDAVIRDFGDKNPDDDPVILFYELFLREYDAKKRMQRGVFYTPRPVVRYIVQAVDEVLRSEYALADGLADLTTWAQFVVRHPGVSIPSGVAPNQTFVQVLDPATGTGTFLVEVIDVIHRTLIKKWVGQGLNQDEVLRHWNEYVPEHLLPRVCGFELLMAPYAIAHLKVGLKLHETGYEFRSSERTRIFLTNSLEPAEDYSDRLVFAIPALAHEVLAVNQVKSANRFTVVIGNPPYFAEAGRGGDWIAALMRGRDVATGESTHDYFTLAGGSLGERTTKWINDDYVKFLRLSQRLIELAGVGVVAMITNHSYVDNPTFRGVRESLLGEFDSVRILDLHGNSTKKEQAPGGGVDENVFEIRQGVAIGVLAKTATRPTRQDVEAGQLWGSRVEKYEQLSTPSEIDWHALTPGAPDYLLIDQDSEFQTEFKKWLSVAEILPLHNHGIITKRDALALQFTESEVWNVVREFVACPPAEAHERFGLPEDVRDWSVERAQEDLRMSGPTVDHIQRLCYRPFNYRYTYYTGRARGFIGWPVDRVMRHMLATRNVALVTTRQTKDAWGLLATRDLVGHKACSGYDVNTVFPLYVMNDPGSFSLIADGEPNSSRLPNLDGGFVDRLKSLDTSGQDGPRSSDDDGVSPEAVLAYVYGVLHSPNYRRRYADQLRSDYARVPIPESVGLYREIVRLGSVLLSTHLLESTPMREPTTRYEGPSTPHVARVNWEAGTVWLDATTGRSRNQASTGRAGFVGIPETVWRFHIGGYQVLEKWLKDRTGRSLTSAEINQFQSVVDAIAATVRLMDDVDEAIDNYGGWPFAFAAGASRLGDN